MPSHQSLPSGAPREKVEWEIDSPVAQALNGQTKDTASYPEEEDTKYEQLAMEAQLLQLTKGSAGSIVQISSDQLFKLLASMNELRGQVAALNASAKVLSTQHVQVTEILSNIENLHGCIEFRYFPKLPLELRRMIWRFALVTTDILGLLEGPEHPTRYGDLTYIPTVYHPPIRWVCQESRTEALKTEYTLTRSFPGPPTFCNKAVDTTFFFAKEKALDVPSILDQLEEFEPLVDHPIEKFAVQCMWGDFDSSHQWFGLVMHGLSKLRTKEVVLVLGSDEACSDPNLIFTRPTRPPRDMLPLYYLDWAKTELGLNPLEDISWEQLDEHHLKIITNLAQHFDKRREELRNSGLDQNYDSETDECFDDPNEWTVTKVTYMEATTAAALRSQTDD